MVTKETLVKFGLKEKTALQLKEVLKSFTNLQEVYIDIYPENPLINSSTPFMLLLRTTDKNVLVENDKERLILKRNDEYNTYLMNILYSEINECYVKCTRHSIELIINVQNIYYKIFVLN